MEAELIGADIILANLKGKESGLPKKLKNLVTESTNIYSTNIKVETPVKKSNLQKSLKIDDISDYEKRLYIDLNQASYAPFVIGGTRPHIIEPVFKQALYWKGAEHPVKRVMHPGTPANDYFTRGIEKSENGVKSEIEKFKEWLLV